jgi:membrane protein
LYSLLDEAADEYSKDRGELVAAGLAFYTLLSLAPLVIIAVAIAGAVLGRGAARREAFELIGEAMGPAAASTIDEWVQEAASSGGVASVVGFVLVLYTASRLGAQLREALNQVWNVDAKLARGFRATVRDYVARRLFAFLLVLASGPLLLAVFASRALLFGLNRAVFGSTPLAGILVQVTQGLFSLVLVWAISAVVFKVVPDTRVGWRAVTRGAALTSLLFNLGNVAVGLYLGRASVAEAYGAAGSVIVVLLWLYFSAQMFIYGAEVTQVYARRYGRGLSPEEQRELLAAQQKSA